MADEWSKKHFPVYVERRSHVRRTVIESRLIGVVLGDSARGVLIDVGEGGVAVQPFVPLPVGAESDINFETPNGIQVRAHGMVAWVGENGRTGIRFTDVEPQSLEEIRRWTEAEAEPDDGNGGAPSLAYGLELPRLASRSAGRSTSDDPVSAGEWLSEVETVVRRAMAATEADGAAIALSEEGQVRCVATIGEAPSVGVFVTRGDGIAGQCLLAARPMICCNAGSDARVKQESALALGMKSCAMVPVMKGEEAIGVLAVFATKPVAFDETHLEQLEELARTI